MTIDEYTNEAQRLRPLLKKTAMRFLHSEKDADDIVQDALLRLWQMHATLHLPIESLAIVIVRNLCISHLRKQKKQYVHLSDKIADINENNATAERIERVMGIIDNLPDIQQTLLRLRHMDGMDSRSIAQMTGNNSRRNSSTATPPSKRSRRYTHTSPATTSSPRLCRCEICSATLLHCTTWPSPPTFRLPHHRQQQQRRQRGVACGQPYRQPRL